MKTINKRLVPTLPTYLDALPLEIKPGITQAEILAVLMYSAGKVGTAHAKGEAVSPEYQKAFEDLYNKYKDG